MNRYIKNILVLAAMVITTMIMQAQSLNVSAPQSVGVGQRFQVSFSANAQAQNFQGPNFKGFSVLSGPHTSYSSSISIINGHRSSSVEYSYEYIVSADQLGTFTVGAASCVIDGKKVTSKPFTIKVVKAQSNQNQSSGYPSYGGNSNPGRQSQSSSAQSSNISGTSLFARANVSKSNPYQGEQVIITYKIYTQVSLQNFQLDKLPGNKGFWSEDLSEGKQIKAYDETVNGKQYRVAEIRRGAMFAQESGKLTIEPLTMDVLALVPRPRQRTGTIWDLFDDPFFNSAQAVEKELHTNALTLKVKPLPPSPNGFSGGVGVFSVKTEVDNNHVRANEAVTYRVTISGRGNLMLLQTPQINFPKIFDVYEPKVIDNISRTDAGVSGSRTFEWVLIPQSKGNYEIPALHYVYFNPGSGKYETQDRPAIAIKVDKGDPSAKNLTSGGQNDVKLLNSDINHIKMKAHLHPAGHETNISILQWVILGLLVLLTIVAVIVGRKQQALQADEKGMRLRRATKLAKKRLRVAEKYLHEGDDNKFYEEIYKALWGCLSDKYGIELSQLSRDTVEAKLQEKQVAAEQHDHIMHTIEDVDYARFAPGDPSTKKQQIYDEVIATIIAM
jgi:hypothetical protein